MHDQMCLKQLLELIGKQKIQEVFDGESIKKVSFRFANADNFINEIKKKL